MSTVSMLKSKMRHTKGCARICVTALALVLAGCGGGADSGPAPVAFVPPPAVTATTPATPGTATPPPGTTPPVETCTKASAKVGQVAKLSTRSHGVSGTVTVIDDCTLELRNFSYDGLGLARVFVYGGKAGNYAAGFPIGNNLRGTLFANQTLMVTLKPGDLEKLDGISIWCSDANVSFGDGLFAPV